MSTATTNIHGVLVDLSIKGAWGGKADDEHLSNDVQNRHSLTEGSAKVKKSLFPPGTCGDENPHVSWMAAVWQIRQAHYNLTMPWQKPLRLLAARTQAHYESLINEAMSHARTTFNEFIAWYDYGIEGARRGLNGSFRIEDYPTRDELTRKFKLTKAYQPVPEASHYSDILVGPAIEAARNQLTTLNEERLRAAVDDVWGRVLEPLHRMTTVLSDPSKVTFRDSLIGNISDIADLIPQLNITQNYDLELARDRLKELARQAVSTEALKNQPVLRAQVAAAAAELAENFGRHTRRIIR